jgi:hypothetical protein
MTVTYKQGDRLPSLNISAVTSDGSAYDLTGATVVFNMRTADGLTIKVNRSAATLVSGPAGTLRYDWATGDLDTAGDYHAEFECTIAGRKLTVPTNGYIPVRVLDDIA